MRVSSVNKKGAIAGGILAAAACAAAVPVAGAHASTAGTRVTGVQAPAKAGNAVQPMSTNGCSSGTVCMYTSSGWNNGSTEHHWWQYGCYNLVNETGTRYVFNNQTGGAGAKLWTGKDCTGKAISIPAGKTWSGSITPIWSVSLFQ